MRVSPSVSPLTPTTPAFGVRHRLQLWVVTALALLMVLVLTGMVLSTTQGASSLALVAPSDHVVRQTDDGLARLSVVVPAGERSFTLRVGGHGHGGSHVLQAERSMFETLQVRYPDGRLAGTERFYAPAQSDSQEVAAYFQIPLDLPAVGDLDLIVHTRAKRDHMLSMQLLEHPVARRMERRASMGAAARYGGLMVLALLLLVLHLSTREPVSLAYVWFVMAAVMVLLIVNGHLYLLPFGPWVGRVGEAGIGAARLLFVSAGLRLALLLGHAQAPPPQLRKWVNRGSALLVALAATIVLGWWPQSLLAWDVLFWGAGALVALGLCARMVYIGAPFAVSVVTLLVATLVMAVWNDLADAGHVAGIWWTLKGFQIALLCLCGLIGASLVRRVEGFRLELHQAQAQVAAAVRETHALRETASTDALTGLPNRRTLDHALEQAMQRAHADDTALSVLFIDIDHFKKINDRYGHAAGDDVLRDVAKVLRHALRGGDQLGRYGGEEFVAVLPGADVEAARISGERLRAALESATVETRAGPITLTASVGIGVRRPDERDLQALLQRADRALYQAKHRGRNQVFWIP